MTGASVRRFTDLRAALAADRTGLDGPAICSRLSDALDDALRDLCAGSDTDAAIVALGGYGRREQCLWSDVDVMILHRGIDTEPLVRSVLYPLWDANLKVGHAVRTIAENRDAAAEFDTLTSLLSARLVAGDAALFGELVDLVTGLIRNRPLAPHLAANERHRRRRDPYPTMTADLKEGRGALRTHQGFWWERRRASLIGLPVDTPGTDEIAAHRTLLTIRNALHAAAGRADDRFVPDLREAAAAWLGTDQLTAASRLTTALHVGDRLADVRWPDLHAEPDPLVGLGRRIFGAIRSRFSSPARPVPEDATPLGIALKAAGRTDGAWFDPPEEHTIRSSPPAPWTEGDRNAFLALLSAGARGRTIFGRLEALGWVAREFPEWEAVATAPQLAPFHDHPVGAHLWRDAGEMGALIAGGGELRAIAEAVGSGEELLLAAFLHDIGKGRGGDHELIGADLATTFLRRTGFGAATIGVVADAVRLHLLLSQTATRRDIADPRVVEEIAARIGDLHRLRVLYLLTIADLRATGTTMWNDWRASLLERLYRSVHETLEAGAAPRATPDIAAIIDAADASVDRRLLEEHLAAMPAEYLDSATPREVLWHLDIASRLDGPALLSVDRSDSGRVLVAGADRTGFLLAVCRAFTANGIGVLDARLRTRADGIALDTFHVCDDRTGAGVAEERWEGVRHDLGRSLTGAADVRPAIRDRVAAYRRDEHDPGDVEVRASRSGRHTLIEVRAPDRIGLLADVVEALHSEGLDVHLARIDTMGHCARDVFYVRRLGVPIVVESELLALRRRIEDRLRA
jgi:[protein-PII] uridylyltransferase